MLKILLKLQEKERNIGIIGTNKHAVKMISVLHVLNYTCWLASTTS